MKKENILLRVSNTLDWLGGMGASISVTAWDKKDGYMIDEHITEEFPRLENFLDEPSEGDMYYYGKMSIDELINVLSQMGFTVEKFTGKNFQDLLKIQ